MNEISQALKAYLTEQGAVLVGFADLTGIPEAQLLRGAAVAVRVPPDIVRAIGQGPTPEYHQAYHDLNRKLDEIVENGAAFLQKRGYRAVAHTRDSIAWQEGYRTALPHKTFATNAGLGWIGKCDLLVTYELGSAVRISALETDAPLTAATPVTQSACGSCTQCVDACPAGAITGALWDVTTDRDALVDIPVCREMAISLSQACLGVEATLCGRCFVVCPHTQKALSK